MLRNEYGSIQQANLENPSAFDDQKVAQVTSDTERQLMHNLPNLTSPGRLMIGPKVSTNEIMMGP